MKAVCLAAATCVCARHPIAIFASAYPHIQTCLHANKLGCAPNCTLSGEQHSQQRYGQRQQGSEDGMQWTPNRPSHPGTAIQMLVLLGCCRNTAHRHTTHGLEVDVHHMRNPPMHECSMNAMHGRVIRCVHQFLAVRLPTAK